MAASEAGRRRAKRATDPLDEKVRARLRGDDCGNAGSITGDDSAFVDGIFFFFFFFSDEEVAASAGAGGGFEDEDAGSARWSVDGEDDGRSTLPPPVSMAAMVRELVVGSSSAPGEDRFRWDLAADVAEAVERLDGVRSCRQAFRRAVMGGLREAGYDAGICKARWTGHGGGSYEYIDVVVETTTGEEQRPRQQRYVVDVEFAAEFEIARQTAEYERVAAELPRVYVGRPEELSRLLRLLASAARRSLLAREMHVPPWRMGQYMRAKWLGPYRRTVNPRASVDVGTEAESAAALVSTAPPPPSFSPGRDVKFRCVGFEAAARTLLTRAAARAR